MFKKLKILFVLLLITGSGAVNADLAIIYIKIIKAVSWIGNGARNFFEYVLEMGESRHKRYWSRKMSVGKQWLPKELSSHEKILEWVRNNPLGIAYINTKVVDDTVKVLFVVNVFEDL
ncbi:hypothetical protein MNBD_GAMMA06-363 [hydrothermal vent metagenome]|uniref:Uncharacterized protein n=1 Tax=hydrothermal vent metagenome TaxID=652676 RepID=A0A3B0WH48_9ZZZZ